MQAGGQEFDSPHLHQVHTFAQQNVNNNAKVREGRYNVLLAKHVCPKQKGLSIAEILNISKDCTLKTKQCNKR